MTGQGARWRRAPVQPARATDLFELAPQLRHAVADHPPVGFDLGFAGTAEEAEAAALPFEVGPAAHEASSLIIEMGEFDLEAPFGGRRAFAEDFEDQARAVDDLGLDRLFQIALLDRGQRGIDDQELGLVLPDCQRDLLDLARPEQRRRLRVAQPEGKPSDHVDSDRSGKSRGLVEARFGRARIVAGTLGQSYERSRAPAQPVVFVTVENAQSSSEPSISARLSGWAGWTVEIACL